MYKDKKILAIIPAREGSKGLPGKNWKYLENKPLISWTIEQAVKSCYIDKIIVSTDAKIIIDIINQRKYDNLIVKDRDDNLSLDDTPMFDVLEDVIVEETSFDYILLLQPTSPIRLKKDIDRLISMLIQSEKKNSIVSICEIDTWANPDNCFKVDKDQNIKEFPDNLIKVKTRQANNSLYYFPNGSMFMSKVSSLMQCKSFYQKEKTMGYIMKKWQQFDIDDEDDFLFVENIFKIKGLNNE